MRGYNVVDDGVIDAPPEVVWDELVAELNGARRFWVPHNTFRPGPVPPEQVGGEVQVVVHTRGADKRGLKLRCTARTRVVEPARRLVADYVDGVFRGMGTFTLEPLDGGRRTRLSMTFQALPHGWLTLLARLVDIGAEHSKATRNAFAALDARLSGTWAPAATAGVSTASANGREPVGQVAG
jgi:uncharacterized protein YndB with AHSA1/START domain